MSTIEFNQQNKPSIEDLRQLVQEAGENYDPVEELLQLERQLTQLEQEHQLESAEFYRRYQAGDMGDNMAYVAWAGRYRLYTRLIREYF